MSRKDYIRIASVIRTVKNYPTTSKKETIQHLIDDMAHMLHNDNYNFDYQKWEDYINK